ncbi:Deoxyribonuclease-2-alpha, partial [Trichinella papuae]
TPEKQIPGAAVCLENANVYNAFSTAAANFIEIMNISIILILISLNCCTAQVATCKDDADNNPPNVVSSSIMKSEGNPAWAPSAQNVDPNDAAAWFVHTVPNFLAYLGGYSWPPTETAKGHMFLCLSLSEAHLNSVAKAVRYQEPYIYVNNLTPALLNQHIELSNLATGVEIRLTPFLEHAKFTTKGVRAAANIQAFGKHTKSFADIYAKVLRMKLSASIRIWAPSDARSKSICKGQYHLRKISSPMQLDGVQVSREADSAKWALIDGKNTVCFTTNDYKVQLYVYKMLVFITLLVQQRFFVYKPPNEVNTKIMKSEGNPAWNPSRSAINTDRQHSVVQTMANFILNDAQIKVVAYSDDPPNLPPRKEKGKAKGVLLIDIRVNDAAAWFLHTVPNFLAHLGAYSWPQTETAKGHMFLCVSFIEAHLNSVAKAIRYQQPYIYANNLPDTVLNQHNELSNLVNAVDIRVTPFVGQAKFTTKAAQAVANIEAFGKHTKSFSDIYARVLKNKFAASIRVWAPSDAKSKSVCKGQYHLRKVASPMQFAGDQVSREADSAKWALIEGKNTVCFTTNDYKAAEKQIPGAAVCLENAGVYNAFSAAAVNVEACNKSFVYKPPNEISTKVMKSGPDPAWGNSVRSINNAQHSIGRTMVDFVRNTPQIKVLAYNNDPPNLPPGKETSKAKGVLLVDNTVTDAAAWFIHTAPNFLAHLGGYTWPAAETAKGHMFLCLSLNEIHLNSVAKALRYQEPYIYANNLPVAILNQHEELSNLVNGIEVRVTPFLEHARFVTKRTQVEANVQVFGKHTKSFSDIYGRVLRNKLSASIRIWAHSDARSKSICKGQHKLRKIASPMQFADSEVSREADSTRWALVEGKNTVCLTTNDYKASEKQIPGAAVCIENAHLNDADNSNCYFDITRKQLGARYFVYKPPNVLQTKIMQSGLNPAWAPSAQPIQSNNGHSIVQTMAHFIADNPNIKVLAYSDDPPNLPPRNEKSKAKGVLLIDNSAANAAAWLVHTVPKFLSHLGGYSWPQTETAKGHIFLCLSINEESLNAVARAVRYQEPYIYANNLPLALLNQHNELSNLATGVEIRVTPFLEHAKLATRNNGANVQAFGKHTKSFADMYERVLRNKLSAKIRIWAPSDVRSKSICRGQYHLRKIVSPMQFDGVQVSREADSAKWALVEGKNTVCFTTNDYKVNC